MFVSRGLCRWDIWWRWDVFFFIRTLILGWGMWRSRSLKRGGWYLRYPRSQQARSNCLRWGTRTSYILMLWRLLKTCHCNIWIQQIRSFDAEMKWRGDFAFDAYNIGSWLGEAFAFMGMEHMHWWSQDGWSVLWVHVSAWIRRVNCQMLRWASKVLMMAWTALLCWLVHRMSMCLLVYNEWRCKSNCPSCWVDIVFKRGREIEI